MKKKNFYKILRRLLIVLLLVVASILIFSNKSFFLEKSRVITDVIEGNKEADTKVINQSKDEDTVLPGKIRTPGALKITNLLGYKEEVVLSKDNIITVTNAIRKEKGNLSQLTENAKLKLSAEKKIDDMFSNQYFEHISKEGRGIDSLTTDVGYKYILIGENLAMGNFKDDKSLVDAWMNSLGHRENILNKNYKEIGVAVRKGVFEGKEVWMAVEHFGTPTSVCPSISQSLHKEINDNQKQIDIIDEDLVQRLTSIEREGVPYEYSKDYIKKAEEYNNLVIFYNKLIDETRSKTNTYNEQVRNFNNCLIKYE